MRIAPTIISSIVKRRAVGKIDTTAKIGFSARISNLTGDSNSLTVGKHSRIDGEIIIYPGAQVEIGDYCYIGKNTRVWAYSSIKLKDYVIIAHHVSVMDSTTHPVKFLERKLQVQKQLTGQFLDPRSLDLKPAPIVMEEGVWVCANATILRGVRIGREAIISAGMVVRQTVPSRTVVR